MADGLEFTPASSTPKKDPAWNHCQTYQDGLRKHLKCIYCGKVFKGGGIYRFKEHLSGRKGGGPICDKVPGDVKATIQNYLDGGGSGRMSRSQMDYQEDLSSAGLVDNHVQLLVNPLEYSDSGPNKRRKKDVAWLHCEALKVNDRVQIKCKYCGKIFKGGGIYRFKEHLAGRKGSAPVCLKVSEDIRKAMQLLLDELPVRPSRGHNLTLEEMKAGIVSPISAAGPMGIFGNHHVDDDDNDGGGNSESEGVDGLEINLNSLLHQGGTGNGKEDGTRDNRSLVAGAGGANVENSVHVKLGRFLYDVGASFDALDSAFFSSFSGMFSHRGGAAEVLGLSSRDLRGWILKNLVKEVNEEINRHKSTWERTGCSILVEQRTTESGRIVLNFLVQCARGTVFLKSVDASNIDYSADDLYGVLKEVVEIVGPEHVLQVITHVGEHYAVAGKNLMDNFPSLYWAPCAANCIDLMLEDFGKFEIISGVIERARSITKFFYNQSAVLKLMRTFTYGNDILQQGPTRSATNFTSLKRLADFKLNLQTMVTSPEWMESPYSKLLGGMAAMEVINDRSFWSDCIVIIRLTSPLLRALNVVSSQKRGAMGYVLAAIYRAKEAIRRELTKSEEYMVYWNIIDERWQLQKHLPIQAAGFFLNPKFFYGSGGELQIPTSKMLDCIERLVPELPDPEVQDKTAGELNLYKSAAGDLGRKMAVRTRETMLPAEWWSTYGGGCPNLARLAVRILSQPCGIPVCNWNHIPFEKLHSSRNCLERQRLADTILVQCNFRLKQMSNESRKHNSGDVITFENNSLIEDWIAENEMNLEDYGEMDWMALVPSNTNSMQLASSVDETEDLGTAFGDPEILNGLV
ncbi:unnamed protein product [Linum tenue]|uniref:BED-type domain-containing protein n=1 Tax=Linum tenue TaxID=586396 RepID=A0AAV0M172_9ROSI|nr:unnamed protein product [Linum tenue]